MPNKTHVLTIAGLDPSSGAGLSSDIKTFEAHNLYGLSVCTAITVQNDITFKSCKWIHSDCIMEQIKSLFDRFTINYVKIGIIENWSVLLRVTNYLKKINSNIKIVLDPVLKASAGYDFHTNEGSKIFEKVLKNCFLITPNYNEIKALFPKKSIDETIEFISEKTNLYLKGGHRIEKKGWDELYYAQIIQINIPPIAKEISEKHGSGCVLSSSIAGYLAKELPLEDACRNAKYYTERFLNSNESLLGTHSYTINNNI